MRVFAFFPFSPLDSSKHTIALPQKTMTPVTPIPSYCPPKNRAVIIIRLSQYSKPANKQPIGLRLLIIKQVAFESITDVNRRIIMMPYPILPHSTFSALTSLARSADRIRVVARAMHNPVARPAGMDSARPLVIWFRIIRSSPFPSFYSGCKQKYRDRVVPVPVSVTLAVYTSISTFIVFRCSWASVTARNFILVSRTSFNALETTSSVCRSDSSIYSLAAFRS